MISTSACGNARLQECCEWCETLMFHLPVWDAVLQAWSILELSVDTNACDQRLTQTMAIEMANPMPHNLGLVLGVTCAQLDRNETTVGCRALLLLGADAFRGVAILYSLSLSVGVGSFRMPKTLSRPREE